MIGIFQVKKEMVTVRRGGEILGKVKAENIVRIIQNKKFFASDRISKDGKNWMRLDQHGKYKKYFSKNSNREESLSSLVGKLSYSV